MSRFAQFSLSLVTLLMLSSSVEAGTPIHHWSQSFGGTLPDAGYAVVVDGAGNSYHYGLTMSPSIDLGGGPLLGTTGGFLAKYDASGAHLWSQRYAGIGGTGDGEHLALDAAGNLCVTAHFTGTINLGGGDLISAGAQDVFLAKFSTDGVHQWSLSFGSTANDWGCGTVIGSGGDIYLAATFAGDVDLGGGSLGHAGLEDAVLAKFDPNGVHQWSQSFGGSGSEGAWGGVVLDAAENLYFGAAIGSAVDFGGGSLPYAGGGSDVAIAKFDPNGVHQWSQSFGSAGYEWLPCIVLDVDGNILLTPSGDAPVDFGGGLLPQAGSWTSWLVKFDGDGNYLWGRSLLGSNSVEIRALAVGASGDVFLGGPLIGTMDLGDGPLVSINNSQDVFVAKFDRDGVFHWSDSFGGTGNSNDFLSSIAVDGSGGVILSGLFSGPMDLGGGDLAWEGNGDAFLAKLDMDSQEPVITALEDVGNDQGRQLNLRVHRSGYDRPGSATPVTAYEAYRRDDPAPAAGSGEADLSQMSKLQLKAEGWSFVGSMPAHGEAGYGMDVPTLGDSTVVGGEYLSTFFVRAATADPYTFFDSIEGSGYSLDNLSPGVPQNLNFGGGLLSWDESSDADFDYFTVYGANGGGFESATVVDYSVTPSLDVSGSPYGSYYVTATDFSGNESPPASLDALTPVEGLPSAYVLSVSNYPNPFNPSTTVKYTVPSTGVVRVAIYDVRGALVRTLLEAEQEPGAYSTPWNGRSDSGASVASGIYFARIEQNGEARGKKLTLLK